MLLFIALGQWLVGVPPLRSEELSGAVLAAFAVRGGLSEHPSCNNEPDPLSDFQDMATGMGYAESWERHVLELATR